MQSMLHADLHIHSIHSGHAYGTFYDIVREAARKNLQMIALTDHGPAMPGTSGQSHFHMGARAPREIEGVRILWGCEANVVDEQGNLDLPESIQERLDLVLVNFHAGCGYPDQGIDGNTRVMQRVLENPRIRILTHPTNPQHPYHFEPVIEAALANGVLPELNLSYLKKFGQTRLSEFKLIVDMVKAHGSRLVVNSDAHFLHEIGDDRILAQYRRALGLRDELILNCDVTELQKALGIDAAATEPATPAAD